MSLRGDELASAAEKPRKEENYAAEVSKLFRPGEELSYGDLKRKIEQVLRFAESTAKSRIREYISYKLVEKDSEGQHRLVRGESAESKPG